MSGLIAGMSMARRLSGLPAVMPDEYTMIGALTKYVSNPAVEKLQPMNSNFGLLPSIEGHKKERKHLYAERALAHMQTYIQQLGGF